jgi:hypothetical protein
MTSLSAAEINVLWKGVLSSRPQTVLEAQVRVARLREILDLVPGDLYPELVPSSEIADTPGLWPEGG